MAESNKAKPTSRDGTEPTSGTPRYLEIAQRLRARIEAGEFAATKNQLPGERALSTAEKASLETIRRALAVLVSDGLITIRPGSGTYVRDFKPIFRDANKRLSAAQWQAGHAIWSADLGLRPLSITNLTVTREQAPEQIARILGADEVVVRRRVFVVERRRVQMATSYLPANLVAGSQIEQDDTGPGGTFARLAELGVTVSDFDEDVRARVPSPDEASQLGLGRGAIVVEIVRTAKTSDGRAVEVNQMVLDADAYVLHWSFTS